MRVIVVSPTEENEPPRFTSIALMVSDDGRTATTRPYGVPQPGSASISIEKYFEDPDDDRLTFIRINGADQVPSSWQVAAFEEEFMAGLSRRGVLKVHLSCHFEEEGPEVDDAYWSVGISDRPPLISNYSYFRSDPNLLILRVRTRAMEASSQCDEDEDESDLPPNLQDVICPEGTCPVFRVGQGSFYCVKC